MVLSTTERELLDRIPIPQADDLEKVFAVVELVASGVETSREIADVLGVVERQGLFYLDAARSLRLIGEYVKPGESRFYLTGPGRAYVHEDGAGAGKMRRVVLASPVMRFVAGHLGIVRGAQAVPWPVPEVMKDVVQVAGAFEELDLNSTTALRRAYTVRAWIKALEAAA